MDALNDQEREEELDEYKRARQQAKLLTEWMSRFINKPSKVKDRTGVFKGLSFEEYWDFRNEEID